MDFFPNVTLLAILFVIEDLPCQLDLLCNTYLSCARMALHLYPSGAICWQLFISSIA